MIVDASAVVAIVRNEAEGDAFAKLITDASWAGLSASSFLEACIVIDGKRTDDASRRVTEIVDTLELEMVPFTPTQARIARQAYRQFGKGSGHAAKLNFGDCMAYAAAIDHGEPLLFKGNDFSQTDVKSVL